VELNLIVHDFLLVDLISHAFLNFRLELVVYVRLELLINVNEDWFAILILRRVSVFQMGLSAHQPVVPLPFKLVNALAPLQHALRL